ncbi:MAG: SGNH/GDSL hydrolase family protein, partial [Oscillospiraceae bacterium]|nr:SGNH/GDSL hydrolase family protein [Oscillospiraceae bacterium]
MKRVMAAVMLVAFCLALMPVSFVPVSAAEPKSGLLSGLNISVMGDSISTYAGWSDSEYLTDASCTHRYGEAYYGPVGGDYHNTDLLVTDTWWHQAATELGANILMSNASNSTGLFSVPDWASSAYDDWELWLHEFLAWKSRPYFMGKDGVAPDIIALYIGSNEAGRTPVSQMGSVYDVDFAALIQDNGDSTYTYTEPATVAEAYCILLHKLSVTYPNAEIYCFTAVPSAGGNASTGNSRMARAIAFNKMVREVANYHSAILVDVYEEFNIDPDDDGV